MFAFYQIIVDVIVLRCWISYIKCYSNIKKKLNYKRKKSTTFNFQKTNEMNEGSKPDSLPCTNSLYLLADSSKNWTVVVQTQETCVILVYYFILSTVCKRQFKNHDIWIAIHFILNSLSQTYQTKIFLFLCFLKTSLFTFVIQVKKI